MLTDNPISGSSADEFGFREHAEVLCRAIEQSTDLPLTVGVFGSWGSGKSSFLNICRDLLRDRGFVAVAFNPWKYDQRDEIWHALIQTLLDELIQLAEQDERTMPDRVKAAVRRAWELRSALAWLAAGTLVRQPPVGS
jgi:predicted KAP-like P-loop ATPase